ncbi:MAG TPA: acyl carrier protein [Thermoanaerobaculia bacterium]|jgi:acyl carrier protein
MTRTLIRAGVVAILGRRGNGAELHDTLPPGSTGLGLDSVVIVEVLLECEERFGVVIATELLGQAEPLTVGAIVDAIGALLRS